MKNNQTKSNRVVQTEEGTWLAHWCGVPGNTPPIEKRKWSCLACFNKPSALWRQLSPVNFIVWEHIKHVEKLGLRAEVCCKRCKTILNSAAEALVEVF